MLWVKISLFIGETKSFQLDCIDAAVAVRGYKMTPKAPTGLTSSTFILHCYLLFCYAEWWLNNMHYPHHQPQESIFPVLLVRPSSLWSDGMSFPAYVGRLEVQFSQPNRLICLGKRTDQGNRWNGSMKMREHVGSIYVLMGHLISVFLFQPWWHVLKLSPLRSALLLC